MAWVINEKGMAHAQLHKIMSYGELDTAVGSVNARRLPPR